MTYGSMGVWAYGRIWIFHTPILPYSHTSPNHGGVPEEGCYRMSQLVLKEKEVTLLDLLDRILDKGILLNGDITISVADVDLIYLGLKVLLSSVDTVERMRTAAAQSPTQIEEK